MVRLLRLAKDYYKKRKTYIFCDNLKMHYSQEVKSAAHRNNQVLLFNASYCSPLNPIERLWLHAKRIFARGVIENTDFKSEAQVTAMVEKSLISVPAEYLRKHIRRCYIRMRSAI